jgi:hypothetical protein
VAGKMDVDRREWGLVRLLCQGARLRRKFIGVLAMTESGNCFEPGSG